MVKYDISGLEEMAQGSVDFLDKMLASFRDQTPKAIEEMILKVQEGDWMKVSALAHKIKPSIDLLVIEELMPVVRDIEENAKLGLIDDLEAKVHFLYKEVLAVIADLEQR